jgi:hypothetical protein
MNDLNRLLEETGYMIINQKLRMYDKTMEPSFEKSKIFFELGQQMGEWSNLFKNV